MNIIKRNKWIVAGILLCSVSYTHASMNTSPEVELAANTATSSTPRNPFAEESTVSPAYSSSTPMMTSSTPVLTATSLVMQENELLSQAIKQWAANNHYKLFWNSKKDYLIYNTITLSGNTDDDILQSLGELFFSENYGLVVKKYAKNHVIVVDEM
ncbi:TPA: toxin co-regulated pilus biosynthesis Q family protein [Enterobacter mori]|uniref:toxin co-regulated pilus biosynthesis Q family protein n=1 Tax=Enterobacter mori TaxID=539813 RepID=UPI0021B15187|nr:toxin co-regulated pilus biosynthesis Q family protein [Enterobacter mori]MCT6664193.1 toxin co-regulated pilus biosynthesis Q family protein [Enterobacter mori]